LRGVIKSLDQDLPVERITTMEHSIGDSLQGQRFQTLLLGLFASVALVLASVGIYGVVAWNVTQRTREIGVRLALGATRRNVLTLVIGQSMRIVLLGIALGTFASFALAHLMQKTVFGISPFDPLTFVLVILLLSGSALLACWLPARRATKVNPIEALRAE